MPNWCDNRISITGPNALINKISMTVNAEEGILNVINPIPAELKDSVSGSESAKPDWQKKQSKELIKKYGYDNWYDWCLNNWGTKWDACDVEIDYYDDSQIEMRFNTAWSPPEPICKRLREMFDDIHVSWFYDEPGMEFAGYL